MTVAEGLGWERGHELELCLQGAHVTHWRDVLFLSSRSRFEPGVAIRGGIPVIFPWFGDDPLKQGRGAHGFARRLPWRCVNSHHDANGSRVTLELEESDSTRSVWPRSFRARLEVRAAERLEVALEVQNLGREAFRFEAALHTYLRVGDVRRVRLSGLEGARYLDKLAGFAERPAAGAPLTFDGPIDRVYLDTEDTCVLEDRALGRTLVVEKRGSRSTVVWNPWAETAAKLADLGDEWPQFLCVETANVGDSALELEPGASHRMSVALAVR